MPRLHGPADRRAAARNSTTPTRGFARSISSRRAIERSISSGAPENYGVAGAVAGNGAGCARRARDPQHDQRAIPQSMPDWR